MTGEGRQECCRHLLIGNYLKVPYFEMKCTYGFAYKEVIKSFIVYLILRPLGWWCVIKTNLILKSRFGDSRLFFRRWQTPGHLATADQLTIRGPPWFGEHNLRADTHDTPLRHPRHPRHLGHAHDMPPESFVRSTKAHDLGSEMQLWVVLQFCYCYC